MALIHYGYPVYNPSVPFVYGLPGFLPDHGMFMLEGLVPMDSQGFAVNLQLGQSVNPRDDVALHLGFRFTNGSALLVNTIQGQQWDVPVEFSACPLRKMDPFQIHILVDRRAFRVALNNQHFCEFHHRMDPNTIRAIAVDGSVVINSLRLEFPGGLQETSQSHTGMPSYNPHHIAGQPGLETVPQPAYLAPNQSYSSAPNNNPASAKSMFPTGMAALGTLGALGALAAPLFYPGKNKKMMKKGKKQHGMLGSLGLPTGLMSNFGGGSHGHGQGGGQGLPMGLMSNFGGGSHGQSGGHGMLGPGLGLGGLGLGAAALGYGMHKQKHGGHKGWKHHSRSSLSSSSSGSD